MRFKGRRRASSISAAALFLLVGAALLASPLVLIPYDDQNDELLANGLRLRGEVIASRETAGRHGGRGARGRLYFVTVRFTDQQDRVREGEIEVNPEIYGDYKGATEKRPVQCTVMVDRENSEHWALSEDLIVEAGSGRVMVWLLPALGLLFVAGGAWLIVRTARQD